MYNDDAISAFITGMRRQTSQLPGPTWTYYHHQPPQPDPFISVHPSTYQPPQPTPVGRTPQTLVGRANATPVGGSQTPLAQALDLLAKSLGGQTPHQSTLSHDRFVPPDSWDGRTEFRRNDQRELRQRERSESGEYHQRESGNEQRELRNDQRECDGKRRRETEGSRGPREEKRRRAETPTTKPRVEKEKKDRVSNGKKDEVSNGKKKKKDEVPDKVRPPSDLARTLAAVPSGNAFVKKPTLTPFHLDALVDALTRSHSADLGSKLFCALLETANEEEVGGWLDLLRKRHDELERARLETLSPGTEVTWQGKTARVVRCTEKMVEIEVEGAKRMVKPRTVVVQRQPFRDAKARR